MNHMYNHDGSTEPDPQSLGIIPANDPFWGDPEYPTQLRLSGHDGIILHVVVISNVGPHHLVWNCTEQRLRRLSIGVIPDEERCDEQGTKERFWDKVGSPPLLKDVEVVAITTEPLSDPANGEPRKCTMCGKSIWKLLADTSDVCGACQYKQILEEYDDIPTPDHEGDCDE